jgi:ferric-dicitrate binding protein FerR (iron transport regulator)
MSADPRLDELLVAYLSGDVSPEELSELEARLASDPAARDRLARLSEQDLALRQVLSLPAEPATVARPSRRWRHRLRSAPTSWVPLFTAAGLLIAFVMLLILAVPTPDRPSPTAAARPAPAPAPEEPPPADPPPVPQRPLPPPEPADRPAPPPVPPTPPPAPPPEPAPSPPAPAPPPSRPPERPATRPEEPAAAVARVLSASGEAEILAPAGPLPARPGTPIPAGSGLQTGGGQSRLAVAQADGTRIELGPETTLSRLIERGAHLERGGVSAEVTPQPRGQSVVFTTPHAEVRVLGTTLRVAVSPDSTRVEVRQGRVRVLRREDGATVDVSAGNYAVVLKGLLLTTRPLQEDRTLSFEAEEFGTGRAARPAEGQVRRLYLEPLPDASGGRCVSAPGIGAEIAADFALAKGPWHLWVRYRDDDGGAPAFEVRVQDQVLERVAASGRTKNWIWKRFSFPADGRTRIALRSIYEGVRQTNLAENLKDSPYAVVNRWDQIVLTRDAGYSPDRK